MNEEQLKKLLKEGQFQVLFFLSRDPIPIHFAIHTWILTIDENNNVRRWEVGKRNVNDAESFGYVYQNIKDPTLGMLKYFWHTDQFWDSQLIGKISGGKDSLAEKVYRFVENESKNYLFKDKYVVIPGPNSNTYTQWVLDQFPELRIKLPWNAFGKNYAKKLRGQITSY